MPLFLERPHSGGHLILYQFGGTHCHCLYRIIHPSCENLHLSGLFLRITLLKQRSGNFCLFLSLRRYRITAKKWEKRRDCIVPYWVLEVPYYITGLIETALRLSWGAILLVLGGSKRFLVFPKFSWRRIIISRGWCCEIYLQWFVGRRGFCGRLFWWEMISRKVQGFCYIFLMWYSIIFLPFHHKSGKSFCFHWCSWTTEICEM